MSTRQASGAPFTAEYLAERERQAERDRKELEAPDRVGRVVGEHDAAASRRVLALPGGRAMKLDPLVDVIDNARGALRLIRRGHLALALDRITMARAQLAREHGNAIHSDRTRERHCERILHLVLRVQADLADEITRLGYAFEAAERIANRARRHHAHD